VKVMDTSIPDVKLICPVRHGDDRGYFSEVWNRRRFAEAGMDFDWVQDNQSCSAQVHTLRGLHFQTPPYAQTKLVRVLRGTILDAVVDLRYGSPWYGQHVVAELSADSWTQILVPKGFAHGFLTLEPDTEVLYKVDVAYATDHDAGVAWDDPDLAIPWPVARDRVKLSDKDRRQPAFRDLPAWFTWP
jgi:dTDP-4-dehydrorhamnose 3,5-epimerase